MITSIVINYKRPENVREWMAGIRSQTVPSQVWVWDNSGDYTAGSGEDVLIRSSRNFYCQPWVQLAGMVQTEYVYHQDDDKALTDNKMFEKLIGSADKYPDAVFGWNGRIFTPDINWDNAYSFPGKGWAGKQDIAVDMINTGVCFLRTGLINGIRQNPFCDVTEKEYKYGDDMVLSKQWKHKRITEYIEDGFRNLDEHEDRGAALSKQSGHMPARDELCRRLFR